jgi:hypothetical protein
VGPHPADALHPVEFRPDPRPIEPRPSQRKPSSRLKSNLDLHDGCAVMTRENPLRRPSTGRRCRLLLGLMLLGALVAACTPPDATVPTELLGKWMTDDSRYAGRTFELRSDAIVFGTGPYSTDFHALVAVEPLEPSEGWTPYRFSIRESDAAIGEIEVAYRRGATPELRFRHRSEIWRPEGAVPDPVQVRATDGRKRWVDAWMKRE